jgi:DNA (cytosine-5)-methyltransferase 1
VGSSAGPTPRATDGSKAGPNQRGSSGDLMLPSAVMLLPTPTVADARGSRNATADRSFVKDDTNDAGWTLSDIAFAERWGEYAPAITRWEQVIGRPAPAPTELGTKGQPRLSPRFVEWLMGLPDGWVCDVPGISRNDQLRILGNGVVPAQAAYAYRWLLSLDGF